MGFSPWGTSLGFAPRAPQSLKLLFAVAQNAGPESPTPPSTLQLILMT